jgi:hydrogenase nickel incorporation protein HypA/HybF
MHELSLAHGIVSMASEAAARAAATRVRSVTVRVGALSGVEPDALRFSYDIAAKDTPLEGSTLTLVRVPLVIWCAVCAATVELPSVQRFRCPTCNTPSGDIRQGRELDIDSLEIEG